MKSRKVILITDQISRMRLCCSVDKERTFLTAVDSLQKTTKKRLPKLADQS